MWWYILYVWKWNIFNTGLVLQNMKLQCIITWSYLCCHQQYDHVFQMDSLKLIFGVICTIIAHHCNSQSTTDPLLDSENCKHDLTGPMDVVFVMAKPTSVTDFIAMRNFVKDILQRYTVISPGKTRVAVILVGPDVTEVINYISRDSAVHECEFFHPRGLFRTDVTFRNKISDSRTNSKDIGKFN